MTLSQPIIYNDKPKVGVVTFTDPRAGNTSLAREREVFNARKHFELVKLLKENGFEVIDPIAYMSSQGAGNHPGEDGEGSASAGSASINNRSIHDGGLTESLGTSFGIGSPRDIEPCARILKQAGAECLIMGCWVWTDSMLPVYLQREMNLPTLLYAERDPSRPDAGVTCLAAVGCSLWEEAPNRHAITHRRLRDDRDGVIRWVRGVSAYQKLRRSTLLLWGGSCALRMEHLLDDIPRLKSFLIGEVLTEDQYMLVKRADRILAREPGRVDSFLKWLETGGAKIVYDPVMVTRESLSKQVALYLAARDRLKELEDERIIGVSIKCQPELSCEYGATACFLPAFLPFGVDAEGPRDVIATVCEGDIKGLISSVLLQKVASNGIDAGDGAWDESSRGVMSGSIGGTLGCRVCDRLSRVVGGEVPALFGDFNDYAPGYIVISNCGASSVYYAANSARPEDVLGRLTISAQCQGVAGAAIGYFAPEARVTVARLSRVNGRYFLQLGVGRSVRMPDEAVREVAWGRSWPRMAVDLGIRTELLLDVASGNHFSIIPGDYSQEVIHACREAGIPVMRIDRGEELVKGREFVESLEYRNP
ncbi:MAG: hypothetical protein HPY71_10440 [Firmicutes bacterium]|nr:hypothetical protein [Bacillota bacterium]